jgi:lipopolysaccharide export system permease protein
MDVHVLLSFLPILLVSTTFFVLILEIAELFVNIVQFMQNEVAILDILNSMLLYLPRCLSYALPIALLFSVSYQLGTMYANNELIVVLGSGISLMSLTLPLMLCGALLSAGLYLFEENVVIPSTSARKQALRRMLRSGSVQGASDVTIVGENGRLIWSMKYFDDVSGTMTGVSVIERNHAGTIVSRLDAQGASWNGSSWTFNGGRRFIRTADSMTDMAFSSIELPGYDEDPSSFRSGGRTIDELKLAEALTYLRFLQRSGLPSVGPYADFYRRFSYAATPFLVAMLSSALAGLLKKNILLMSLLVSLVAATLFYVIQMISMLLAKNGLIPAPAGAFTPVAVFVIIIPIAFLLRRR